MAEACYTCSNCILAPSHLHTCLISSLLRWFLHFGKRAKILPVSHPLLFLWHISKIWGLRSTLNVLASSLGSQIFRILHWNFGKRQALLDLDCEILPRQPGIRHKSKQSEPWLPVGYWFSLSATAFSSSFWHPLEKQNMRFEKLKILRVTGSSGPVDYVRILVVRGLM